VEAVPDGPRRTVALVETQGDRLVVRGFNGVEATDDEYPIDLDRIIEIWVS